MLQYMGRGQLWGIPGEQGSDNRWHPAFSLKDGTVLYSESGGTYKVHALHGARRMKQGSGCQPIRDVVTAPGDKPRVSGTDATRIVPKNDKVKNISSDDLDIAVDWTAADAVSDL
jgi:hypothetical protein